MAGFFNIFLGMCMYRFFSDWDNVIYRAITIKVSISNLKKKTTGQNQ